MQMTIRSLSFYRNNSKGETKSTNTSNNRLFTALGSSLESCILPAALILFWVGAGAFGKLNTIVLPSFDTVVDTFWSGITSGQLLAALAISIRRVLLGYLVSSVLGIVLGILIGLSGHAQRLTGLLIQVLRPIPPIAWIPLVILWMGIGENSKVFLIFLGGFFTVLINVIDGIRYTDKKLTEVAWVMETPKLKYITRLVIPAALPSIFTGLKVALGSCWTCVVAAELVASTSGIGYMISNARNFGQMDVVIVGMLSIGLVGKLMDTILNAIGKRLLAWNT
jgi:sulfonate transport system permease protein